MALLGISLIVASVVLFCLRRPDWLPTFLRSSQQSSQIAPPPEQEQNGEEIQLQSLPVSRAGSVARGESQEPSSTTTAMSTRKQQPITRTAISSPRPPPPVIQEEAAPRLGSPSPDSAWDGQTTPKASAVMLHDLVPSFALSAPDSSPSNAPSASASRPKPPPAPPSSFGLMAPPPRPAPGVRAYAAGSSTLPIPNRGAGLLPNRDLGAGLTPPPTHSSKPKKPSLQVALAPGHSPLDWARLSGGPGADLRGLPRDAPYLRVTPTMLRYYTGRKGKDAWMALGGRVYNITPYIPFHPGGEPELLRGAGRDGTTLFGEVHPWVNYEGMLSACLVGIYVTEEEGAAAATAASGVSIAGGDGMGDMD
ncbi:hypothetical protein B0H67DRAFT_641216 [Lasiosphaeris hirsuta]|uniref:Cytochrome b5 heme-binding domain-containing protein n=1 Tax=Lasiosphaeris hirsuta TaxID=260670 RepID=A0AA40AZ71_9PEZI|nr:hypothetical protein B0H67DRAFT_641216 [Lasiosphaeris hirsuta]